MSPSPSPLALDVLPGPYIRRLQQIAVALFVAETEGWGLTPVQYGALLTVSRQPGVDQRTLASLLGLDTSTTAGVVDRLEARGWLRRGASSTDKRVKLLSATAEGVALLAEVEDRVLAAQARILSPLSPEEQGLFMRMLRTLVDTHAQAGEGPSDGQPA
ncbi:MarR family winged helix-turn-helix transcriptional regulator [Hydrogenophaga soli]